MIDEPGRAICSADATRPASALLWKLWANAMLAQMSGAMYNIKGRTQAFSHRKVGLYDVCLAQ